MYRSFVLCVAACAGQEAFPPGIRNVLQSLRSTLADVDGARAGNDEAVKAVSAAAAQDLAARVARDRDVTSQEQAAQDDARKAVLEVKYVGGCPRDLGGCPSGWSAVGAGICAPSAAYEGPCVETDLSAYSASEKEAFAIDCQASWPCEACRTSFAGCPVDWVEVGALCLAPAGYAGICSPAMHFAGFSTEHKARWSAMCSARWPCA